MTIELLILADDLTGAADTAAQFLRAGVASAVAPVPALSPISEALPVYAVNTETRHVLPHEAFRRIASIARAAHAAGVRRFYKKIDSTFRGNVGAELEALMQAAGTYQMVLVPAFPCAGRTTRNGIQYVHGRPLHETGFAADPRSPITESDIAAILRRQTAVPVYTIDRCALETFSPDRRHGIFVFDAECDEDLYAIGRQCARHDWLRVMAGAAAFAGVLPDIVLFPRTSLPRVVFNDRLLVVNGSLNETSIAQVSAAQRSGVYCGFLGQKAIALHDPAAQAARESLVASIVTALHTCRKAMLSTSHERLSQPPEAIAAALGACTAAVLRRVPDVTPAFFGGDTASAACNALKIERLYPCAEIEPGLTVHATDRAGHAGVVIVKSGGFGSVDAVASIEKIVLRASNNRE